MVVEVPRNSGDRVRDVKDVVRGLVDSRGEVRNRDVVAELHGSISRQAVHQHLQQMVEQGELERVGAGRATRYRRAVLASRSYPTEGLEEYEVWRELSGDLEVLRRLHEVASSTISYIFTEMVNNAVDHSGAERVEVRLREEEPYLIFDVEDRGIGIFAKVAEALGTDEPLEAAQRLTLGKFTTWPERHTGEGIFFSSRTAHVFMVEANGLRWTVDNERDDWAVGEAPHREGTLVRFWVDPARAIRTADVFRRFTDDDHRFDRTRSVIKMLDAGTRFVSRSEAKRLAAGLEPFERVVLDFRGVTEVGQGFVDELFRVWASDHPEKELEVVDASEPVRFMIERGLPRP